MVQVGLAILVLGSSVNCFAGWFGPSNYADCVEEVVRPTGCEMSAKLGVMACRYKFRERKDLVFANCVIDNLSDTGTDFGAKAILLACRAKQSGEYSHFEKCILERMPGAKNDIAARAIVTACRE